MTTAPQTAVGPSGRGSGAVSAPPTQSTRRSAELGLLGFAAAITTVALVLVEANLERGLSWDLLGYGFAYLVLFVLAHMAVRRWAPYADPLLLPCVALLNGLGLVMIHRLDLVHSYNDGDADQVGDNNATQQMLWTTVGLIALAAVLATLKDHRVLARYGYTFGIVGCVLLAIPALLPTSMSEQYGAKIWIELPFLSIQPAEAAKILLLIFFAAFLMTKRTLFRTAGRNYLGIELPRPRDLGPLLAIWGISVGVMVFEKDLGASLLFYSSFLIVLYVATARISWVLIGLALFAAGSVIAYFLFGHVQVRVQNWWDPFTDPDGAGYQMVQSLFSFATGGIFGTGLGNGQPGTVPAASTDFIIAAVGEELGLVGLAGVLMLYTIVIIRGFRTALAVRDSFGKLLAVGMSAALAMQLFIVVGGVTKLIPQTGLTTPWMSYGGSSLIANYVLLAILLRISHIARRPLSPHASSSPAAPLAEARTELIDRV
ncbi:FtsW/RodA/SpoVE family cell cycle protein [Mycobacteroides abscessus]|nr:FtsW/RodA/SpoVE family cell cycle protein [Mycobacteroides abscessus]MDM2368157.1 FtsW/RodA/SpoVE family cell cycle protein [Mycobacteroides abscessus]MDM2376535.1 FtsW/RodA/SpoVE family cell cycle protein [Mycobacteroides abscessus]MDM2380324.1 FtsW/RodA/SpoVE family cell cycle protein [Mycobacteroides abscessus]MDM2396062.1 FtsW/RodA/SpoVE family cell cycle protein [Mycobacteroides abscessus]